MVRFPLFIICNLPSVHPPCSFLALDRPLSSVCLSRLPRHLPRLVLCFAYSSLVACRLLRSPIPAATLREARSATTNENPKCEHTAARSSSRSEAKATAAAAAASAIHCRRWQRSLVRGPAPKKKRVGLSVCVASLAAPMAVERLPAYLPACLPACQQQLWSSLARLTPYGRRRRRSIRL